MIKLNIMKNKISILIAAISAIGTTGTFASECIGSDCEIASVIQSTIIVEPLPKKMCSDCERKDCPFDNKADCEIWHKKPTYKQNAYPRAPHFNCAITDDILYAINSTSDLSANEKVSKPLLERYLMLQRASESCCEAGIIHKMRQNGADEEDIYNFLKDDANYYAIKTRCLMTANDEISDKYSYGVDGKMIFDVRNACLCKNKDWFNDLISPFKDIYKHAPQFMSMDFNYKYTDTMKRDICVSVNKDIQTTMNLLESCPK